MAEVTPSTSKGTVLYGANGSAARSFDLQSWQGLTEILRFAREAGLHDETYAEFRDLVLQYAQTKGDQELRKRIETYIADFKSQPNESQAPAQEVRKQPKDKTKSDEEAEKQSEKDQTESGQAADAGSKTSTSKATETSGGGDAKADNSPSVDGFPGRKRPTPRFEQTAPAPAKKTEVAETVSDEPKSVPPQASEAQFIPKKLPVDDVVPKKQEKQSVTTDEKEKPAAATSSIDAVESDASDDTPKRTSSAVVSIEEYKARITEIKRDISRRVGNPITLIDSGNPIGRTYTKALLEAMKASAGGIAGTLTQKMEALEKAYDEVVRYLEENGGVLPENEETKQGKKPVEEATEPADRRSHPVESVTSKDPKPQVLDDKVETSPDREKRQAGLIYREAQESVEKRPTSVKQSVPTPPRATSEQGQQKRTKVIPLPTREQTPSQVTRPVTPKDTTKETVSAVPQKTTHAGAASQSNDFWQKISPRSPQAEQRSSRSVLDSRQAAPMGKTKTTQSQETVSRADTETPSQQPDSEQTKQQSSVNTEPRPRTQPENADTAIASASRVGATRNLASTFNERPPKAQLATEDREIKNVSDMVDRVTAAQSKLNSVEVTEGLARLLDEWSLFKTSGFLGMGPSGMEHPLYKQLSVLPMSELMTGRFEGATRENLRILKDYINAWRNEQGITYNQAETFEHYLRRVVQRVLKRQSVSS